MIEQLPTQEDLDNELANPVVAFLQNEDGITIKLVRKDEWDAYQKSGQSSDEFFA